jgi:hypothetical protein
MAELHVFGPIAVSVPIDMARADLEFYGVDHYCPSYVARVFFNAPDITIDSSSEAHPGYAGSFAIFGHQRCVGAEGHCEVHEHLRRFDDRPSHPLTRAFKRVVVTDALRRHADVDELTITVVVTAGPDDDASTVGRALLNFQGLQLTTFT